MADSYTRGGWAKLDQGGAANLSYIIASFQPSHVMSHTRMLLALYASMDSRGVITMGRGQLAEIAGVTPSAAQRFLAKLESDGHLVVIGNGSGKSGGRYVRRAFRWIADRTKAGDQNQGRTDQAGDRYTDQAGDQNQGRTDHPTDQNQGRTDHHQMNTEYSDDGVAPWLPPGARPTDRSERRDAR